MIHRFYTELKIIKWSLVEVWLKQRKGAIALKDINNNCSEFLYKVFELTTGNLRNKAVKVERPFRKINMA